MRTIFTKTLVVTSALVLSACTSSTPGPTPEAALTPKPQNSAPRVATLNDVNGTWQPVDSAGKELGYRALFKDGNFVSYDRQRTDPNELLAKGTYKANSTTNIALEFVGASSGQNSATCQLLDSQRLNCTLANGTPLFFKKASNAA